jgi:hypothetical protein
MVDGGFLMSADGSTWMFDSDIERGDTWRQLRADGNIPTSAGCTMRVRGGILTIDRRWGWLPRTIDQKWIEDRVFNWDCEFCTHANIEKAVCFCLPYSIFSTLMDPIC